MQRDTIQAIESGTVGKRTREYLEANEIEQLIKAVKQNRNGQRNALMVSIAFNHALRVSELIDLRWSQINFITGRLAVSRVKGSNDGTHYLRSDEIRALKELRKDNKNGEWVFLSEQNAPMTKRGFHKIVANAGIKANLPFPIHPHMLRHSKGYQLANRGTDTRTIQDYLGHKNIQNTVRYTQLDANRVKGCEQ